MPGCAWIPCASAGSYPGASNGPCTTGASPGSGPERPTRSRRVSAPRTSRFGKQTSTKPSTCSPSACEEVSRRLAGNRASTRVLHLSSGGAAARPSGEGALDPYEGGPADQEGAGGDEAHHAQERHEVARREEVQGRERKLHEQQVAEVDAVADVAEVPGNGIGDRPL